MEGRLMYYSVYNVAMKDIRTDFAYWQDKEALKRAFEKHLINVEQTTSTNSHTVWHDSYSIMETPLLKLKDIDIQNIKAYFNGEIKNVQVGWFNDLKDILDWERDIESIIEIKTFGFASAWYIILRNNDIPLIIKHKKDMIIIRILA